MLDDDAQQMAKQVALCEEQVQAAWANERKHTSTLASAEVSEACVRGSCLVA